MTERQITRRLMRDRYRRGLVCPNYTPGRWWECDVFELTEAGFFREYEVKISRSDFMADRMKDRFIDPTAWRTDSPRETKHSLLERRSAEGPVQFWYVCPAEMIDVTEVPEWSGLIWIREGQYGLAEVPRKPAPRLHNTKASILIHNHVRTVFYYRFHDMFWDHAV